LVLSVARKTPVDDQSPVRHPSVEHPGEKGEKPVPEAGDSLDEQERPFAGTVEPHRFPRQFRARSGWLLPSRILNPSSVTTTSQTR
jgi:hypothetical protein